MKFFQLKENGTLVRERYILNLEVLKWIQVTFEENIHKVFCEKIWNNEIIFHGMSSYLILKH